jgi:single-strand DNA-binding protein
MFAKNMFYQKFIIMARINNHVMLIGNLGADPIIKTLTNGNRMARMSLATKERIHRLHGEPENLVKWHKLVAWGDTADIISKMLHKGKRVAIEGKLNKYSWEDKTGRIHTNTEIIISDFTLIR